MRGNEARALCAEFHTFYVQEKRGKADLTKYREASIKIFEVILNRCKNVEKASIDEAYLDLTDLVLERMRSSKTQPINIDLKDSYVVGSYTENDDLHGLLFIECALFLQEYNLKIFTDPQQNLKCWLAKNQDFSQETPDKMLIIGAQIVQEIREDIFNTLQFHCSAGIAHNKVLKYFYY